MNNIPSSLNVRLKARNGNNFTTSGLANSFVQTNVVIIPKKFAYDFMLYCQRNPKPVQHTAQNTTRFWRLKMPPNATET